MANNYPITDAYITRYAEQVEQEILTRLTKAGKIASGKLADSVGYKLKFKTEDFELTFYMADYGPYVDKGVNGYARRVGSIYSYKNKDGSYKSKKKSKFIQSLMKWCDIKGLPKQAAFPIRRNIWKFGIRPTNFFTIPTTRRQKQFEKGVEVSMVKDLDNNLAKELK